MRRRIGSSSGDRQDESQNNYSDEQSRHDTVLRPSVTPTAHIYPDLLACRSYNEGPFRRFLKNASQIFRVMLERAIGIEPTSPPWKGPLYH